MVNCTIQAVSSFYSIVILYKAKFGGGKVWQIDSFMYLATESLAN